MDKHYIKFKRTSDSFPNDYELDTTDDFTNEFYKDIESLLAKKGVKVRVIRPNGTKDYCTLYISHDSWLNNHAIIKLNIGYTSNLTGKHLIKDSIILDTFMIKGRTVYKRNLKKEAFRDFIKFWLSDYITADWHDVYLLFEN